MSYIGNQPVYQSFLTDTFSGTGSQSAFTMTVAPPSANSILVTVGGVLQNPSAYGVNGNILTFTEPPPGGSNNIVVRFLALTASNVTTPAYRTITEITAISGQTTFSVGNYTPGFVNVFRNGVKLAAADYTATNGATVVLSTPCAIGDIVHVESFYVSSTQDAIPARGGVITPGYLDVGNASGSGAMLVPSGSNANRPTSATPGMVRMNTESKQLEFWNGSAWTGVSSVISADILVVAGGGSGGTGNVPGAGGAGGVLYNTGYPVTTGQAYPITIGAGGAGRGASNNGNNSFFGSLIAIGGGRGGNEQEGTGVGIGGSPNAQGGSGGGASYTPGGSTDYLNFGGYGLPGQGYVGGKGSRQASTHATGAGGGAGGPGAWGTYGATTGATGGVGISISITGSAVFYGGGGGGSTWSGGTAASNGGNGGGGAGGYYAVDIGVLSNGTANTGGGGGAGYTGAYSGNGGSGIVIIRIPDSYTATFSAGLATSLSTAVSGFKIYRVTAGTGTVTFT